MTGRRRLRQSGKTKRGLGKDGDTMPAKSKAQQRLFQAAEHGANFPLARKLRGSMTMAQLGDFARGSMHGKPAHVSKRKGR
jgi:hypothetical protein